MTGLQPCPRDPRFGCSECGADYNENCGRRSPPEEYRPAPGWLQEDIRRAVASLSRPHGCICPPGAEAGCKGALCPRRALEYKT